MAHQDNELCQPARESREGERLSFQDVQGFLKRQLQRLAPDTLLTHAWDDWYQKQTAVLRRLAAGCHAPLDEVEDIIQDAWLEVIRHLEEFIWDDSRPGLRRWLARIVRSKVASRLLYKLRHPAERLGEHAAPEAASSDDPARRIERTWEQELLQNVLADVRATLSEENARLLELRLQEGRDVAEVAALLGLTPEQVWARQHWLLGKLRARMRFYCGEPSGPEKEP